jgi:hypothetical protein
MEFSGSVACNDAGSSQGTQRIQQQVATPNMNLHIYNINLNVNINVSDSDGRDRADSPTDLIKGRVGGA